MSRSELQKSRDLVQLRLVPDLVQPRIKPTGLVPSPRYSNDPDPNERTGPAAGRLVQDKNWSRLPADALEARKGLPELVEVSHPHDAARGVVGVEPPVDEPDQRLGGQHEAGLLHRVAGR
jgi:hypothetical protein